MSSKVFGRIAASLQTVAHRIAGKQQVGKDLHGNKYFVDPSSYHIHTNQRTAPTEESRCDDAMSCSARRFDSVFESAMRPSDRIVSLMHARSLILRWLQSSQRGGGSSIRIRTSSAIPPLCRCHGQSGERASERGCDHDREWRRFGRRVVVRSTHFSFPSCCRSSRHSWLRHGRASAPTPIELDAEENARVSLANKVAQLNAADQKLRLQEIAERHLNSGGEWAREWRTDAGSGSARCSLVLHASCPWADNAASLLNMERERDQHGGVSRWNQSGRGVAGGRSQ
jgi:NADH:ubiquinone oxidoreductase subunit